MKSTKISCVGGLGSELAARLDMPEGPAKAYALFAHCFTCGKDLKAVARISRALGARGIAVLRFDFTGLGDSSGSFAESNFSSNLDDIRSAVDFMRSEYRAPQLMIGHSLGGAAVLRTAGDVPECRAVVTLAAPADTQHLRDTLLAQAPELCDTETAQDDIVVELAGRPFALRRQLIDDLENQRVLEAVRDLGRPLLVMHSVTDAVVNIDHARRIYEAARHSRSFVSLDHADHLLLEDPADARYAADVIAAWSGRYLEDENKDPVNQAVALTLPPGEVRVIGGDSLRQEVLTAGHHLVADEPEHLGGTDEGPTPYDYLLAALGTCTNMTLRMYAQRKGWSLGGVESQLRHSRTHAKDCEDCESEDGKVDIIEREIEILGDLDEAQMARLMEIADRCPVHRTLHNEIVIRSRRR